MITPASTARLDLRPLEMADHDAPRLMADLAQLLTPEVLAPLPPALQEADDPAIWLRARQVDSTVVLVTCRETARVIGVALLSDQRDETGLREIYLGYLIARSHWGQGVASELVGGLIASLRPLAPLRIIGGVGRDNPASARVLTKSGFRRDRDRSTDSTDMFVLTLT